MDAIDTLIGFEVIKELDLNKTLESMKDHRRLKVFYHKGLKCYLCDRVASRAFKAKDRGGNIHIDLFTDNLVHMNVDHVIPKSKGGNNHLSNLQPCCSQCNTRKGAKVVNQN